MKLSFSNYELTLEYPFGISSYTRTTHAVVLITIHHHGLTGHGEASMARYLGETQGSVAAFLSKVDLGQFSGPEDLEAIMHYLETVAPENTAAKTAIDIALHDLLGKILQKPVYDFYLSNPANMPVTSFTVGIDKPEIIRTKVRGAAAFRAIKVKLGSEWDREIISAVKQETDVPLYIDANQGWTDRHLALEMIYWLSEQGASFIEQPMDKDDVEANAWLSEHSPLPIIADEAMQRLNDLERLAGAYHGINIKLMKCTGMLEASKIIKRARQLNLKIMIGCMSKTSCGIMAAAALAPLCDWADLDGPWLITNNPFQLPELKEGRIMLNQQPGLGLSTNSNYTLFS